MYTAIVLVIKLLFGVVLDILADGNCPLAAIKIWKQGFFSHSTKMQVVFHVHKTGNVFNFFPVCNMCIILI